MGIAAPMIAKLHADVPNWITAELLTHTIEVWQPYYDYPLTADEALVMIMNVSQLFNVMSKEVYEKVRSPARVSSREQEREGFSLDIQVDALNRYAETHHGNVIKLFRIAETASKTDERKTFKELITYSKKHCLELDGLLVYKVDRAARNLFDFVEIERLESEYNVPFICVSQPTENNPAGRMMRRTLANMASFYTEQQSVDVKEGLSRRVKEKWFVARAPFGYKNIRKNGRGIIEVEEHQAANVRYIFQHYAYCNLTIDRVVERLKSEGKEFRLTSPAFPRSSIHNILKDRAYIGEIEFKGAWYSGNHDPLIDRSTWDRVQALLGEANYHSHTLLFAGEFIRCAHCGHPITGESKTKKTKNGFKNYVYYRCSRYNKEGHPRVRIREEELNQQFLEIFDKMRIDDEAVRSWFKAVLISQTKDSQADSLAQRAELQRQETLLVRQHDQLLNMRLAEQVDQETYGKKSLELKDRLASIKLQLDHLDRSHDELADLATKVFELSQTLREKWDTADYNAKRRILEIICLNCTLDDVTLCPTMRKPFDVLAKGSNYDYSRDSGI